jgi:hypothetical protein
MMLWFTTPVPLTGWQQLALLLPLCLSVALVYKATKLDDTRQLWRASLSTWVTIVAGMIAVGLGLYVVHYLLA